MRTLVCFAAAGMFAVVAFSANAASSVYGEAFDTLYRIDLDTRQAAPIGSPTLYAGQKIVNISGLTTTTTGSLYAVAGGGPKLLLTVDPASGIDTVVGSLGLSGQGSGQYDALDLGMTADCDGALWLSSGVLKQLWKVDPSTGATTPVGSTGQAIAGLVARDGVLYGSGSGSDHGFYRIDKQTGAATLIGDFGPAASSALNSVSMSFDTAGTLWAVLNYVPPTTGTVTPDWSDLATIDPATGTMTVLGPITGPDALRGVGMKGFSVGPTQCGGNGSASGAVAAPAGSPWSIVTTALLLGLLGLHGVRRRGNA